MRDVEVHEAVIRWVANHTSLTVIKAHQSGKRPDAPYMMINLLNIREVREYAQEIEYSGDDTITATPIIEMEWEFSLHVYGENPTQPLRTLKSLCKMGQPQEPLYPAFTIHDIGRITNLSDWIKNHWEPRAHCKLFIRGIVRDGGVVDAIEQAPINISAMPNGNA